LLDIYLQANCHEHVNESQAARAEILQWTCIDMVNKIRDERLAGIQCVSVSKNTIKDISTTKGYPPRGAYSSWTYCQKAFRRARSQRYSASDLGGNISLIRWKRAASIDQGTGKFSLSTTMSAGSSVYSEPWSHSDVTPSLKPQLLNPWTS
jgi:hypothetical protein